MGSISEKLEYLNETKTAIKTALINKGVSISDVDTFRSYADKIEDLEEIEPNLQAKSQTITSNTTTTITPDDGFDGLSSVAITTNVSANQTLTYKYLLGDSQSTDHASSSGNTLDSSYSLKVDLPAATTQCCIVWFETTQGLDFTLTITTTSGSVGTQQDHNIGNSGMGINYAVHAHRRIITKNAGTAATVNITAKTDSASNSIVVMAIYN